MASRPGLNRQPVPASARSRSVRPAAGRPPALHAYVTCQDRQGLAAAASVPAEVTTRGSNSFGRNLSIKIALPCDMEVTALHLNFNNVSSAPFTRSPSSSYLSSADAQQTSSNQIPAVTDLRLKFNELQDTLPMSDSALDSMAEARHSPGSSWARAGPSDVRSGPLDSMAKADSEGSCCRRPVTAAPTGSWPPVVCWVPTGPPSAGPSDALLTVPWQRLHEV
jgi:hypothetical protein